MGGAVGAPGWGGAQGREGAGSPASTCLRTAFPLLSSWSFLSISTAAIQLSRTLVSWKRVSFRWKEALASTSWPSCFQVLGHLPVEAAGVLSGGRVPACSGQPPLRL